LPTTFTVGAPLAVAADGLAPDDGFEADALVAHAATHSGSAEARSPAESRCRMDDTGPP
jgi:hypothetical protein